MVDDHFERATADGAVQGNTKGAASGGTLVPRFPAQSKRAGLDSEGSRLAVAAA
jgi:hypothetical protein